MRAIALALLLLVPAVAQAGLFDRELPEVAAGNEAYANGAYDEALARYDAAAAAEPDRPEAHHNRGNALYKLGRYAEAQAAWLEALARRSDEAGAAADYFHIGNAQAQQGKVDEAIANYRRALELDPASEGARRNLERLLRRKQQEQQPEEDQQQDEKQDEQQSGQQQDEKQQGESEDQQQAGGDEQQDAEKGEQPDGQQQQGEGEEQQQPDDGQGQEPRQQPGEGEQQAEQQPAGGGEGEGGDEAQQGAAASAGGEPGTEEMERSDSVRLLDSLREGERNFQLWRYQKDAKQKGNVDVDKEW